MQTCGVHSQSSTEVTHSQACQLWKSNPEPLAWEAPTVTTRPHRQTGIMCDQLNDSIQRNTVGYQCADRAIMIFKLCARVTAGVSAVHV